MLVKKEDWKPQGIDELEPRAWDAIRTADRSILVTASAGAGKTEFLAQKATYLLQTGLCPAPKRILAISFKRDAAKNLAERVLRRCPPAQARRFVSFTFDAFAKGLLDRFRAALRPELRPPASYRIVMPRRLDYSDFLQRHGFRHLQAKDLEDSVAETPLPVLPQSSRMARAVSEYWEDQYRNYDQALLSFHMINRLVEWLLRENQSIVRAIQMTYPFVFLDEFQDTTFAQFELLCTAFGRSRAVFTAVGDDKQRIMGWARAMPDAFDRFRGQFGAETVSLLSNWRSHRDLVRIQNVIARRIDPGVELPEARAEREVAGDVAAIWEFGSSEREVATLGAWVLHEIQTGNVKPHDIAILVRQRADSVEEQLAPAFTERGLTLRNAARMLGDISIQDLLGEELVEVLLPLLRLGARPRSPADWSASLHNAQSLEVVDPTDESAMRLIQDRLQQFVRDLRQTMVLLDPAPDAAVAAAETALAFIGEARLRQAHRAYQRQSDWDRVWNGFLALLRESVERARTWADALLKFEGVGQTSLMTIHKSKGLEFHTMVFYGLDDQTWWSLTPNRPEELNSFFVAFTRARQRAFFTLCTDRGGPVAWIEQLLGPAGVRRIDGTTIVEA